MYLLLGAGVASLLSLLLRSRLRQPTVRCFGFATPCCACGEALLSRLRESGVVSVVLRADAIPRATVSSALALLSELAVVFIWVRCSPLFLHLQAQRIQCAVVQSSLYSECREK